MDKDYLYHSIHASHFLFFTSDIPVAFEI